MQNVQVGYIGIHVPWWFAAFITPASKLGIYSNAIPPLFPHFLLYLPYPPTPQQATVCDFSPAVSKCSHCSTPTNEWEHTVFGFLFLHQFAENDGLQLYPCPCKKHEFILSYGCIVFHGVYVPPFLYPICHWWKFGLVPSLCYGEQWHNKHKCAYVFITEWFIILWEYIQ